MRAASLRSMPTGLVFGDLDRIFPFHIAIDDAMRIVGVGSTLARICPEATAGASMNSVFRIQRPDGIADFEGCAATPATCSCSRTRLSISPCAARCSGTRRPA